MEHVGHPCSYIGLGLETIVGVMRIQEVIGRLFRVGGWLILLADPDALRGLHPLRALHIYDLTHRCILPGEVSFVRSPRVLIGVYARRKLVLYRSSTPREYSIFQGSHDVTSGLACHRQCSPS
jgi:hypothetical protein